MTVCRIFVTIRAYQSRNNLLSYGVTWGENMNERERESQLHNPNFLLTNDNNVC
jgi:hypothetical protein